jgi:hypothetical protein
VRSVRANRARVELIDVPSLAIASGDTLNPFTRRKPVGLVAWGRTPLHSLQIRWLFLSSGSSISLAVITSDSGNFNSLPRAARALEEKVILAAAIVVEVDPVVVDRGRRNHPGRPS